MIYPEIRNIHSPDLEPPNLPEDPTDCEVSFQVLVGPKDGEGEEVFNFTVVTPIRLAQSVEPQWGRGKLVVLKFDWQVVAQAIAKLFAHCGRPTWKEIVEELNRQLRSDLDGNKPADS
jgi:hypothetical protein